MRNRLQSGVGHIALVLVVLVFGAIGAIGYTLYAHPGNSDGSNGSASGSSRNSSLDVPAAPAINTASDLDKADAVLNQVDPGTSGQSDSRQLDSQLNAL